MEKKVTEQKFKFPTETVDLPSKGLLYPKDNPLSSGKIEMKYMTAKEEDILTNQNYINNGTVLDKLLESLIISKVNINDIIIGDSKNDLQASIESGIKFILFEGYKSLKSFPQDELIKKDIILKTKNFESLIYLLSQ